MDAITNTTDETLTECNVVSERIMQGAGPDLKEEIVTRALGMFYVFPNSLNLYRIRCFKENSINLFISNI